ncbi:MAG TPA: hypothetical protein V6D15_08130 [Oculatellaceae cyanobacterium]
MKTLNDSTSACRCCRYFQPEGRRGGVCEQLGVPVRGSWKACSLAMSPFAPSWETLEGMRIWEEKIFNLKDDVVSPCSLTCSRPQQAEEKSVTVSETINVAKLVF